MIAKFCEAASQTSDSRIILIATGFGQACSTKPVVLGLMRHLSSQWIKVGPWCCYSA